MKRIVKSCISFLVVIAMTLTGILYMSYLTDRKFGKEKYYDFYDEKENIDSSHIAQALQYRMTNVQEN